MNILEPGVALPPRRAFRRTPLAAIGVATAITIAPSKSAAADEERVRLTLPVAGLPFSQSELEAAVATRLVLVRDGGAATDVTVTHTPTRGTVVVLSARRLEEVSVTGKAAPEAARLVALAIVAVTRPSTDLPPERTAASDDLAVAASLPASPRFKIARLAVGARTGVNLGLAGSQPISETMVEIAWSLGHATDGRPAVWQIAVAGGFAGVRATGSGRAFRVDTFPMRLGLQRRWGAFTAAAGPVVRPYRVVGLNADGGAMAGGFAAVGADLPLGHGFRLGTTLSCDAHVERVVFRSGGTAAVTSGPLIPWLGIGILWGAS